MMLFLQHSQSASPKCPQPLQEWGKSRSKGLGYVVFFTIKLMIFLILLQNWFIIKHNNISGGNMARTNSEDLLDDDLAAAFLGEEEGASVPEVTEKVAQELTEEINNEPTTEDEWDTETGDFPGQL
ncbi:MAG: hypothetical protein IJU40_01930, partial [Desulfovibrionaceae bacterium]|nr:hypothetical protein [Desulfovibrionaceae bacterium]